MKDDDYKVVSVSKQGFKSVPLFLPNNVTYDPKTNTVSQIPQANNDNGSDTATEEKLVLVPNAGYDLLKSVKNPVSCIACLGPYRTGKSLLLSRFLRDSKAFEVGPTLDGCTRGIWMSTSAIVQKDDNSTKEDFYTFLLDCEGTGDPLQGNDASNARIALTCILISSTFIFNNLGRPDRGSLQFLSYLETIRNRIPIQMHDGKAIQRPYPSFLWVFRDFFLQLPKRKDTGEPYTLKEYMLERVLRGPNGCDPVVDSLLADFSAFDVMSIGCPKRTDEPFSIEEMSTLDAIEWSEFDDTFRSEIASVISSCLNGSTPFQLGGDAAPAKGKQFASWCTQVLELVNSNEVLPNIPDMQQRLLQSLADDAVQKSIDIYSVKMEEYLVSCPTMNSENEKEQVNKERGIAEEPDLFAASRGILEELANELKNDIMSETIRKSSLERLSLQCLDDQASIFAQLQQDNLKRSKASCDVFARNLYGSFRATVQADATNMTEEVFEDGVADIEATFRKQARGPAVEETVQVFLKEQTETDRVFLEKVHGINNLYQKMLEMKEQLTEDVHEKTEQIGALEISLVQTTDKHKEEMDTVLMKTKKQLETLKVDHVRSTEKFLAEQKAKADAKIMLLTDKMNDTKNELGRTKIEMDVIKTDAENKLVEEVAAREETLKKEEQAHEEEVKRLAVADQNMRNEVVAGEEKRKIEQIRLRYEMENALTQAGDKMTEEIRKREEQLEVDTERHNRDLEFAQEQMREEQQHKVNELEHIRREENKAHNAQVAILEQQCPKMCNVM